ncbi:MULTISPECIES: class GN sortase [Microbulbifer]|uniref:Class GN sortase n=1 Tax=Microbulbifer celer TaxID=435905 RepID=A0ABW3U3Q9_9GAMM|nr:MULTISPECIES: class GN sortase [Microbulbifer]UFN56092.1 class GN sortase [Microbulbifer celer]
MKVWRTLSYLLIGVGLWQLAASSWMLVKAELSQILIARAWSQQLTTGEQRKPWPWADTWPVASLQLGQEAPLMVLAGTSGQALAFGPGLHEASALPGDPRQAQQPRTTVIAAHRDTHFRGLGRLQPGMEVHLQEANGRWQRFRVRHTGVVDSRHSELPVFSERGLLLVTCYPFNALDAGGPLRFLVYAEYLGEADLVQL